MAKNKTTETENSLTVFLSSIKDEKRRMDVSEIIDLIYANTGLEPKMWGTSIVGFGIYNYIYESGHSGSAPLAGIASRANAISLYLPSEFDKKTELLSKFGKYKTGKGCIYIRKLEDIDKAVLIKMVNNSIEYRRKQNPG